MELGGNKLAQEYYEAHGMIRDGKPDHEAAPHARYKLELAAKAEAALKAQSGHQQPSPVKSIPTTKEVESFTQPAALQNPFEFKASDVDAI